MTPEIPPTTAIDSDAGRSPCCDADLVLSSPPHGYECRECTRPYDLVGSDVIDVVAEDGDGEGDASDGDDEPAEDGAEGDTEPKHSIESLMDAGECPWCDDYSGSHVGQHASSAHPEAWDDYKSE